MIEEQTRKMFRNFRVAEVADAGRSSSDTFLSQIGSVQGAVWKGLHALHAPGEPGRKPEEGMPGLTHEKSVHKAGPEMT